VLFFHETLAHSLRSREVTLVPIFIQRFVEHFGDEGGLFSYCGRREGRQVRGNSWLVTKRELIIDPGLENPLLKLHRTTDVKSFWKAVHRLLSASIANHCVGLLLQQNPSVHLIAKWTRSMPDDFFAAEALKRCATEPRRKKLLRFDDFFGNRRSLLRSSFYRRYMAAQRCAYGLTLLFWKKEQIDLRHRDSAYGEARGFFTN
jgi:hypothetical protein